MVWNKRNSIGLYLGYYNNSNEFWCFLIGKLLIEWIKFVLNDFINWFKSKCVLIGGFGVY